MLTWVMGCGASNDKEPKTAADTPKQVEEVDRDTSTEAAENVPEDDEAATDEPKSELGDDLPPPVPETWEPNMRDCEDLADVYEQLLRKREMAKLEKSHLSDKQKKKAMPGLERTVEQGKNNWMSACEKIVGTIQVRENWQCAEKAKDLDEFNDCMNGKKK